MKMLSQNSKSCPISIWRLFIAGLSIFVAVAFASRSDPNDPYDFTRGIGQSPDDLVLLINGQPFHTRFPRGDFAVLTFDPVDITTASIASGPGNYGCFFSRAMENLESDFVSPTFYTESTLRVLVGARSVLDQPFPNARYAVCFNIGVDRDPNRAVGVWFQKSSIADSDPSMIKLQYWHVDFMPSQFSGKFITLDLDGPCTVDRAAIVHGPNGSTARAAVLADLQEKRITQFTQQQPMRVPFGGAKLIGCGESFSEEDLSPFYE